MAFRLIHGGGCGNLPEGLARRLLKYSVVVAMMIVGLLLFLDLAYLARGSLEEFPTEEDHGKVRTVTSVVAGALLTVELGLWFMLRRFTRRDCSAGPVGE